MINFPSYYPLEELLQKDTKEIARTGLPYFDFRWLGSGRSLQDLCLNAITRSPSLMNSKALKYLPLELKEKIQVKLLYNRISDAIGEIFPWMSVPGKPTKKNSVFQFLNDFVFDKCLAAFPVLDVTTKSIHVENGNFSIDISVSDFEINKPILRLMRGDACVGISLLLKLENGSKAPWTLMQVNADDPDIWCPFQKCLLCPHSIFLILEDLKLSQNYARDIMEKVMTDENLDLIKLISFWRSQKNIPLFIRILRQLVTGKSINAIDSLYIETGRLPAVVKASLFYEG